MYLAAKHVYDNLKDNATITAAIAAANMFPVVAQDSTVGDFLIYQVESAGVVTKDFKSQYQVEISVFCDSILEAAQKADIITGELIANNFRITSEAMAYAQDLRTAYINLVFNFKL